jgi:hypothetical protein
MERNAVVVRRPTPGPARQCRGSVRVYSITGGVPQLHDGVPAQKSQVQFPVPVQEPLVQTTLQSPRRARPGQVVGGTAAYWMLGGLLQLHDADRVQKVHVHVQLPVPLHEPLAQLTLQVGGSSCAYTCCASRGAKQRAAAASSVARASRMRMVRWLCAFIDVLVVKGG